MKRSLPIKILAMLLALALSLCMSGFTDAGQSSAAESSGAENSAAQSGENSEDEDAEAAEEDASAPRLDLRMAQNSERAIAARGGTTAPKGAQRSYFSALSPDSNFYPQLNARAKMFYDALAEVSVPADGATGYTLDVPLTISCLTSEFNAVWDAIYDDMQAALDAFLKDYPEYFWMKFKQFDGDTGTQCGVNRIGPTIGADENAYYDITYVQFDFIAKDTLSTTKANAVTAKINAIAAGAPATSTYSKLKYIHDYVAGNVVYDSTLNAPNTFDAYGALINNTAVCEGYSKAFKLLCDKLQIPCLLVGGTATLNTGMFTPPAHMWNLVQIDGAWYAVDTTWDRKIVSGNPTVLHDFFLCGSGTVYSGQTFAQTHVSSGEFSVDTSKIFTYPAISATQYVPVAEPNALSLGISAAGITYGTNATLTATLTSGGVNSSGFSVAFYDGATLLGSAVTGSNGKAVYTVTKPAVGTHSYTAKYSALTSAAKTVAVTPATLTINWGTPTLTKVYDTTASAAMTASTLTGVLAGDTVDISVSAAYNNASVGTGKTITATATLSGAQADNYTASSLSKTFSGAAITAAAVTVTPTAGQSGDYNGTTTPTTPIAYTFSGLLGGDTLTGNLQLSAADAGSREIVIGTLSGGGKYNISLSGVVQYTVNPIAATANDPAAISILQGTSAPKAFDLSAISYLSSIGSSGTRSYTVSAPTNAGFFSAAPAVNGTNLEYTPNAANAVGDSSTVTVTISSQNYQDTTVTVTFNTVDKTPLTVDVSGITVYSKIYDGSATSAVSGSYLFKDGAATVEIPSADISFTYVSTDGAGYSSSTPPKDAGSYEFLIAIKSSNQQYMSAAHAPLAFTISQKPLSAVIDSKTVGLSDPMPAFTATFSGFVAGESSVVFTTQPVFACSVADTSAFATGTITMTTLPQAKNYSLAAASVTNGVFKVSAREATALDFLIPAAGQNGWYTDDIVLAPSAASTGDGFDSIGVNGDASAASVTISTETAFGSAQLRVYKGAIGSDPYIFTYKLDKTAPLATAAFTQTFNKLEGVISLTGISDAVSGVAGVKLTSQAGTVTTRTGSAATQSFTVTEQGDYTIAVTDNAGNAYSQILPVIFKRLDSLEITNENPLVITLPAGITALTPHYTGTAILGTDFNYTWVSSNPAVAQVDANGNLTPKTAGLATVTLSAMGFTAVPLSVKVQSKSAAVAAEPANLTQPVVVVPPASYAGDISSLSLIVTPTGENAALKAQAMANISLQGYAASGYYDIDLQNTLEQSITPAGAVTVYLMCAGMRAGDQAAVLHMKADSSVEVLAATCYNGYLSFSTTSFSPFLVLWKAAIPVVTPVIRNASTSGGTTARDMDAVQSFWQGVLGAIKDAKTGKTVTANASGNVATCPVSVLQALYGKDIDLVINWSGETIALNGEFMPEPQSDIPFYPLSTLVKWMKAAQKETADPQTDAQLSNPVTGGNGDIVVSMPVPAEKTAVTPEPQVITPPAPIVEAPQPAQVPVIIPETPPEAPQQNTRPQADSMMWVLLVVAAIAAFGAGGFFLYKRLG